MSNGELRISSDVVNLWKRHPSIRQWTDLQQAQDDVLGVRSIKNETP